MATSKKSAQSGVTGWDGIKAGAEAIRQAAHTDTAEAILGFAARVVSAGLKVFKAGDGTSQVGRFTALRIMEFQDQLYVRNTEAGWHFTDHVLIALWKAEFPTAKCRFEEHPLYIKSARADLNRGRRGMKPDQVKARTGLDMIPAYYRPVVEAPVKAKKAPKVAKVAKVTPVAPVVEVVEPVVQPAVTEIQ